MPVVSGVLLSTSFATKLKQLEIIEHSEFTKQIKEKDDKTAIASAK